MKKLIEEATERLNEIRREVASIERDFDAVQQRLACKRAERYEAENMIDLITKHCAPVAGKNEGQQ